MRYREEGTPLVVVAGQDYGMGSSRDWAAKGTILLGVRAVIAESFERIHRSNLVGMGVLPLHVQAGREARHLRPRRLGALRHPGSPTTSRRGRTLEVTATKADGSEVSFTVTCALDTPIEVEYYRHGGILNYVLRDFLNTSLETA
jgi:aconitate hydratase